MLRPVEITTDFMKWPGCLKCMCLRMFGKATGGSGESLVKCDRGEELPLKMLLRSLISKRISLPVSFPNSFPHQLKKKRYSSTNFRFYVHILQISNLGSYTYVHLMYLAQSFQFFQCLQDPGGWGWNSVMETLLSM